MKFLTAIVMTFILLPLTYAKNTEREYLASLKCEATSFRVGVDTPRSKSILWFHVAIVDGKATIESYGGHIYVVGYYGVFVGKNNVEVPYTRKPSVYKNHYRFQNIDARFTGGSENGMWGEFVVSKDLAKTRDTNIKVDGHYVFKAGDHLGGTIDYECGADL